MNTSARPPESRDCETVGELLAWYVNGTLGAVDRAVVDTHTERCATCRTTLAMERRLVESMRAPRDNVEQSPHAGWQKMVARLDAVDTGGSSAPANPAASEDTRWRATAAPIPAPTTLVNAPAVLANRTPARRRVNWPAALGAAVAVQAAAIAVLAVALVRHRQAEEAPLFHTLASADPTLSATGPLVRIAFDTSVDEATARSVATQANGRILAGPSPDNVYTFVFPEAANAAAGVDPRVVEQRVSELRRQAHVLLVEPVVLGTHAAQK